MHLASELLDALSRPLEKRDPRDTRRRGRATTILSWRIRRRRFESLLRCYGMETRTGNERAVDGRPTRGSPRRPRFRRPSLSLASLSLEHDTKTYTRGKVIFRRTAAAPSVDEFHCALRAPDDLKMRRTRRRKHLYIGRDTRKFTETVRDISRLSVIQSPQFATSVYESDGEPDGISCRRKFRPQNSDSKPGLAG